MRQVTVVEAYWKDALPAKVAAKLNDPTGSDFYLGIREFIPHYPMQMRAFVEQAGHRFLLSAGGHPDVQATLTSMKISKGRAEGGALPAVRRARGCGLAAAGVAYTIRPVNISQAYAWSVRDGLILKGVDLARS